MIPADDTACASPDDVETHGIGAGAAAPDVPVDEVIASLRKPLALAGEEVAAAREDVHFRLPQVLEGTV